MRKARFIIFKREGFVDSTQCVITEPDGFSFTVVCDVDSYPVMVVADRFVVITPKVRCVDRAAFKRFVSERFAIRIEAA